MGVINLGLLVDKIKRKLENSGFIKNTDYASASAAGVVKIGDNISVSSGTISVPVATEETYGVVKAGGSGGVNFDELWNGTTTTTYTSIASSLAHPLTDYKAILVCEGPSNAGCVAPLVPIPAGGTLYAFKNLSKEIDILLTTDDVQIRNAGTGGLNPVVLYGIK